jgi:hypothetical protein
MKPTGWFLLLAALSGGCLHAPAPPARPGAPVPLPARPAPPVTADSVDQSNAHAQCEALWRELDRDEEGAAAPASPAGAAPKAK